MKFKNIIIPSILALSFFSFLFVSTPSKAFASDTDIKSGSQTIRIINVEDYIYEQDVESGYDKEDLIIQFEQYAKEKGYKNARVIYESTDTNETMYNELLTGKNSYDLMCPSDYMIQKLIREGLLTKLDRTKIPNYTKYASKYIASRLDNIQVKEELVKDYAIGYMWGTLGILFNPNFSTFTKRNMDMDKVISDMQYWTTLWNKDYKKTISIKDSVRDTYATGLLYAYNDEFVELKNKWENGELTDEEYNHQLNIIFNRCEDANINDVKNALNKLKKNIFGLEVDSGKEDIVTGKIGINLAWSGDAVYSMNQAEDPEQVSKPNELYYAIPETGANIWFDGWVMPKNNKRSEAQNELAHMFLDFISDPENAAQNMDYIGYTSFIGGDDILDLVRSWYDARINDEGEFDEYLPIDDEWEVVDLSYFFSGTLEEYDDSDATFYTELYLPYKSEGNVSVGRQFFCQYPDEETIKRCAVMEDYKDQNSAVLRMWEDFKSDPLPVWAIILFSVEIALIGGGTIYFIYAKRIKKRLRNRRKDNSGEK